MPTVFITGATGFIGRALCVKMLDSGWRVLGTFRKNFSGGNLPEWVEGIQIEAIENYNDAGRDLEGVDTVIHLAGRVHVMNERESDPASAYHRVNVLGTKRLAEQAA